MDKVKLANPPLIETENFGDYLSTDFSDCESPKTTERLKSFLASNREILPSFETVSFAEIWINQLRIIALESQLWWREPLVNISIEGEVVFEWWHNQKNLTVYVFEGKTEFLKAWGTDMDNNMEEGSAESSDELLLLWKWIAE